jgi:transposase InsO family protein
MDWLWKEPSMPWQEVSIMEQRREFVRLALQEGSNRRELCRRFGIHPSTGYKWLTRWASGERDLADRSRRPHTSPERTCPHKEEEIVSFRDRHRAWGARKIKSCLERDGMEVPALSTVHAILHRHGRVTERPGSCHGPDHRFEKEAPNLLWQMDFKGWVRLCDGVRCHALTIVDDHSRFAICLQACADQRRSTVQGHLERIFRLYGLPDAFFVDNGTPWGDASRRHWTRLRVWLLKLGVEIIYSRPYHPQSRGKNERFHRTLNEEVFSLRRFANLKEVQQAFDIWREVYNFERPHEALQQQVPASRYRPSTRAMPKQIPAPIYGEHDILRTVPASKDYISFKGRLWKVPEAFRGERLAVRQRGGKDKFGVFFASHRIASIDLTKSKTVGHVSEHVSAMSPA